MWPGQILKEDIPNMAAEIQYLRDRNLQDYKESMAAVAAAQAETDELRRKIELLRDRLKQCKEAKA